MSIEDFILRHEAPIRLGFFLGVFGTLALLELVVPRRVLTVAKSRRWVANLTLVGLNTVVLRVLFPAAAVGMALFAQEHRWGLFNYYAISGWIALIASVLLLDLAIYLQHVMMHAVPALWRLHRVHHADLDFDVTTGARFHTLEIVLSLLIKFAMIAVLGPPAAAVLMFEILLNATAMFNHSNVRLPPALDAVVRLFLVTPDMHRVHHSVEDDETNSNFGFNLPWWDRLFGTYRDQPRAGHAGMIVGIRSFRAPKQCARLTGMLAMPFVGRVTDYAINRRSWTKADEPD